MISGHIELFLYAILILLQVPTCDRLTYFRNISLLVSVFQPRFSVWYLTRFHIVRVKPKLYQDFRVKKYPVSAVVLILVANSWPGDEVPSEFVISGLLSVALVGLSSECNRHVEHTLHVVATNMAVVLLMAPGTGLFIFLFLVTCLVNIILLDVRKSFSVSEYVLVSTFISFAVYKAIFDASSLFVLLCLICIAVFLLTPSQHDRDTMLILTAVFAWIGVIFFKNRTHHLQRLERMVLDTLTDLQEHSAMVGLWALCSFLAVIFTVRPISRLNLHIQRKVYHVFMCVVFVSGISSAPRLLSSACTLLTCLALVCELAYYKGARFLQEHLNKFRGKQDTGPLILTPLFLLIGLSIPVWLRYGVVWEGALLSRENTTFLQSVLPYVGVMSVGVGDACAACIGISFGRIHLPGTHKTVEGLLGNMAGQALFMVLVGPYLSWGARGANDALALCAMLVGNCLLEVYTEDIDNIAIPVFASLCIHTLG